MKLRIKGDSLRLRVSKTELKQISRGKSIVERTHFGPTTLSYTLCPDADASQLEATFHDTEISVAIPAAQAQAWAQGDLVSLNGIQRHEQGELRLLVEKDFQCLSPRDEDESDLFKHPNAGTAVC